MEPTSYLREREDLEQCQDQEVCSPISELRNVWLYTKNPPKWIDQIVDIKTRSDFVIKNTALNCHTESKNFVPTSRLDRQSTPRTLVCHDMKGGYTEDKFVESVNMGNCYTFYRWSQIDIFVYFSHHLITIPPLSWINAAHNNGVKILGTFITEWEPGKAICEEIFASSKTLTKFINILVEISVLFKLDGWLLNIENTLDDTGPLKTLVKQLTEKIHIKRPGSMIIWYDSVIDDGKLKWQNELNLKNRCYFDECDGIFLNYSWKEENLLNTVQAAEHRRHDVYVGVDVFGRNFYGGGNFNTYLAVEKIREHNLSIAIFAQGWTHETLDPEPADTLLERFLIRDNAFWKSLWPYLYTHPINTLFETFFYVGVDKNWYKLESQQVQLSQFLHSYEKLIEAKNVSTLDGACICLQLYFEEPYTMCLITNQALKMDETYIHHLFSCDIQISSPVILYSYMKQLNACRVESENDYFNIVVFARTGGGSLKKIVCYADNQKELSNNLTLLELNYSQEESVINLVSSKHKVPADWILRCYVLDIKNIFITDVGAIIRSNSCVGLCGIGITGT
ncbi:hypothetical protein RI129_010040 [Pyrocoelia pectoralis]|uniref:Cytosolic endo-beta-N-acetylglucosaminidase n=1 Tax=Pyrocoelia pectoralis TaxID=417401 RepID=A0AAN7V9K3_9COLE